MALFPSALPLSLAVPSSLPVAAGLGGAPASGTPGAMVPEPVPLVGSPAMPPRHVPTVAPPNLHKEPVHHSMRLAAVGETPVKKAFIEGLKDGALAGALMAIPFGWYARFEAIKHNHVAPIILLGIPVYGALIGGLYRAYQSFKTQVAPNLKLQ